MKTPRTRGTERKKYSSRDWEKAWEAMIIKTQNSIGMQTATPKIKTPLTTHKDSQHSVSILWVHEWHMWH